MVVKKVSVTLIDRPEIPDRLSIDSDEIKELADSIAEVGLKQPILLRPRAERYEVVAGDRRFLAIQSLGRSEINAFVEEMPDEQVSVLRATENLQRSNLTVIEEAKIYKRLHNDHKMSWDQIAKRTGKKPGIIKRRYDLLKMFECLIKAMHEKKIGYAVAEELDRLKDVGRVEYYLGWAVDHGATKEVVRGWVDEELALTRQKIAAGEQGGGEYLSPEPRPVFTSCDLCHGAVDVMKIVNLRICEECKGIIKQNM
ncbi:MAG: ParB/RepB/Spo0J family partition protein [Alphaproteobacteria bacterium]|nr:ParB/RepB/Spo0J family partition protein [Alphaproteobacteria bacterium]